MSAIAAPPEWVLGKRLDPGTWRVLVGLWTFARFSASGPQLVGPSRAVLAERIGISTRTLRTQLATLRALGWIRYEHSSRFGALGIRLAWMEPDNFGDELAPAEVSRQAAEVDRGRGQPVTGRCQPPKAADVGRSDRPMSAAQTGRCQPPNRPMSAAKPADVSTQTLQDLADLAEGPCARAPDRVDRELDALTDPRQQRHREIIARQQARARETEHVPDDPRLAITPEHWAALRRVGAWWQDAEADRWQRDFGTAIRELSLTPEHVEALLLEHDRQSSGMSPTAKLEAADRGSLPPRREVWWLGKWRSWIRDALRSGEQSESAAARTETASPWITDPCALPPRRREVLPC